MSVKQYKSWVKDKRSREASLPGFFDGGVERTINVLDGSATKASVAKWRAFKARHGTQYCANPTPRRAIALRNWGIAAPIPKKGGK
jgi:hypothetical protein